MQSGRQKTLTADKLRQNATTARFVAEFRRAKKPRSRCCRAKEGEKPWKMEQNGGKLPGFWDSGLTAMNWPQRIRGTQRIGIWTQPPCLPNVTVRSTTGAGTTVTSTEYTVQSAQYQVPSTQWQQSNAWRLSENRRSGGTPLLQTKSLIPFSSNHVCFVRNHPASTHHPFHQGDAGAGVGAGRKSLYVNTLYRQSTWCTRTERTEGRCTKRAGKSIGSRKSATAASRVAWCPGHARLRRRSGAETAGEVVPECRLSPS